MNGETSRRIEMRGFGGGGVTVGGEGKMQDKEKNFENVKRNNAKTTR